MSARPSRAAAILARVALLSCAVTAAELGCGDDEPSVPGGGVRGGTDSGTRFTTRPACETATVGAACTGPELCEIGEHPAERCNRRLRCNGFSWEVDEEPGVCAQGCPRASSGADLATCSASTAPSLRCAYEAERVTCGCARVIADTSDAGAGDAGAGISDAGISDAGISDAGISDAGISDAGISDASSADAGDADASDAGDGTAAYAWTCVQPATGCPRTRPRIGEPCVRPMDCDYGECVFDEARAVRCLGGFWVVAEPARPCNRR